MTAECDAACIADSYPLSPMQAGMLFHAISGRYSGVDLEHVAVTLSEPLDEAALLRAWQRVVERHPILRTRFLWEGVAQPVQEVLDQVEIPVERLDWRGLAEPERRERLDKLMREDCARGFDLGQAPLMRLVFVRTAERGHWALWSFHHSLLDGRSCSLVLQEVFAFYEGFSRGEEVKLPLPRPFRDHIEWLRTLDQDSAKTYWQGLLRGFRAPTPLVVARDREAETPTESASGALEVRLSAGLTSALRERAREASVTLNTLVQGAWTLLLHRYSGERDIVFGATRACRRSTVPGAHDMVGLFINTLPMRVRIDPEAPLVPWLQQLRDQQVALREHEHTPLVNVQGWSEVPRGTPLFESLLVYDNQTLDEQLRALGGAWSERRVEYRGRTNYPLTLAANGDRELLLQLEYSRRRFDDDAVARMLGHLQTLLEAMAASLQVRLRDLPLTTEAERRELLAEWSGKDADQPADALLHNLFEAEVARMGEATAVVSGGRTLSYGELDRRANQLAHALRKRGVGPDVLVGLCVNRTPDMIVALLGILKAGGAYVPLDPDYPAERLAFMVEDCAAKVLVTEASLQASIPPLPAGCQVIYLDSDREALAAERQDKPDAQVGPANLAYAIYTSGSTGRPKAALLNHRGLANLAASESRLYGIGRQSRVLQFASLSFDASLSEIALALGTGATLHVEAREAILPGPDLERYLEREKITVLSLTPSALAVVDPLAGPALEQVIVGGEPCPAELAARWAGRCRFFNTYGPTETTVVTTYVEYRDGLLPPVIGRPLPGLRTYLLDDSLTPVPIGVAGELFIGGVGVARGYLNRPDLTAQRFVADPFEPGATLYRTGDYARWRSDGQIEFIGRRDTQVKVRGFRIELGEIEAALKRHPSVKGAAVVVREDAPGDRRLVAYVIADGPAETSAAALRNFLAQGLPAHMLPSAFVLLDAFPLTPNDKLDAKALPAPDASATRTATLVRVAPRNDLEISLATVWERVLGVQQVGITDNFFDLGGNSLSVLKLVGEMERATGLKISLGEVFRAPTIAGLVEGRGPEASKSASVVVPLQPRGAGVPVFCICGINIYKDFAESLGSEQPVYGVFVAEEQAIVDQVIRGEKPVVSIERLVDAYYKAIARFMPEGPYRLAGLSFGGILAMELAAKMQAHGAQVDVVLLLDAALPQGLRRNWGKWLAYQAAEVMKGNGAKKLRRLLARLQNGSGSQRSAHERMRYVDEAFSVRQQAAFMAAAEIWSKSETTYDFKAVLFRASDASMWGEYNDLDEDYGWRRYLGDRLQVVDAVGGHRSIIEPPNVADLGRKARQFLV